MRNEGEDIHRTVPAYSWHRDLRGNFLNGGLNPVPP